MFVSVQPIWTEISNDVFLLTKKRATVVELFFRVRSPTAFDRTGWNVGKVLRWESRDRPIYRACIVPAIDVKRAHAVNQEQGSMHTLYCRLCAKDPLGSNRNRRFVVCSRR